MSKMALVGKCGLYCGACDIYRAQRDDQEWRRRMAEFFKCAPEKVACEGCGALTPTCWSFDCEMVKCLKDKGYDFCYQCKDFDEKTCEKFEEIWNRYLKETGFDLRQSLLEIKRGNTVKWLEECERRYTCPHCGKPTAIGSEKCHHCGKKL
jgi:hypothetical protein